MINLLNVCIQAIELYDCTKLQYAIIVPMQLLVPKYKQAFSLLNGVEWGLLCTTIDQNIVKLGRYFCYFSYQTILKFLNYDFWQLKIQEVFKTVCITKDSVCPFSLNRPWANSVIESRCPCVCVCLCHRETPANVVLRKKIRKK